MTTMSAPKANEDLAQEEFLIAYEQPAFVVYLIICILSLIGLYRYNRKLLKKQEEGPLINGEEQILWWTFGTTAGFYGGLLITLMKSVLTLLKMLFVDFDKFWTEWLIWPLLLILVICFSQQLRWITVGLEYGPAMVIVATESITSDVVATLGGMFYFQGIPLSPNKFLSPQRIMDL